MRRLWLVALLGGLCYFAASAHAVEAGKPGPAKPDPVIEAARAKLYTARPEAIFLLEEAVLQSPQRVDYWIELLRALETDSASPFVLCCYADAALQANPTALPLRWEKARLLPEPAGYDELAKLDSLEPNQLRLRDARQILVLGLRLPRDWNDGDFYETWAAHAIRQPEGRDVQRIVTRGLELKPTSVPLRICQAMLLVRDCKYEAAVALIKACKYQQSIYPLGVAPYPNVSDLLLQHKQPRLAIAAFGSNPKESVILSRDGILLAQAHLLAGNTEQAEKIFEQTDLFATDLLVIANLVTLKKDAEADEIVEGMLERLKTAVEQHTERHLHIRSHGYWPVALEASFDEAIRWIYKKHAGELGNFYGMVGHPGYQFLKEPFVFLSAIEECAKWQHLLRNYTDTSTDEESQRFAHKFRLALATALRQQGKYTEAAQQLQLILADTVFPPDPEYYEEHIHVLRAERRLALGVTWQHDRRAAASHRYYAEHPAELFAARQLLGNLTATRSTEPPRPQASWLTDDEVVAQAAKLDARILPLVIEGFESNRLTGEDRTPWIEILTQHGTMVDVPVLLKTLTMIARDHQRNPELHTPHDEQKRARDTLTIAAANLALAKLTKTKCPDYGSLERAEFWEAWWTKNVAQVVRGK